LQGSRGAPACRARSGADRSAGRRTFPDEPGPLLALAPPPPPPPPPRKLESEGTLPSMLRREPADCRAGRGAPPPLGGPLLGGPSGGGRGGRCGEGAAGEGGPRRPRCAALPSPPAAPPSAPPARSALLLLRPRAPPICRPSTQPVYPCARLDWEGLG